MIAMTTLTMILLAIGTLTVVITSLTTLITDEALRMFPPVIEYAWVERKTGLRQMMVQMKALRDPEVWGEGADEFLVRYQ